MGEDIRNLQSDGCALLQKTPRDTPVTEQTEYIPHCSEKHWLE